ncbi:hypothetical protein ACQPZZ_38315 [Microbispora sp. CA-135349]|uniref:hypothetical protein n=1 Tax=Microbispora sp. CA-135349 TaxID=3239953 RepID=UPI003D89D468
MTNRAVRLGRSPMVAALAVGVALGGATSASAAESTAGSTAGSTSASAASRLGPYGYGSLKLGMSAKQAQRTGEIVRSATTKAARAGT